MRKICENFCSKCLHIKARLVRVVNNVVRMCCSTLLLVHLYIKAMRYVKINECRDENL